MTKRIEIWFLNIHMLDIWLKFWNKTYPFNSMTLSVAWKKLFSNAFCTYFLLHIENLSQFNKKSFYYYFFMLPYNFGGWNQERVTISFPDYSRYIYITNIRWKKYHTKATVVFFLFLLVYALLQSSLSLTQLNLTNIYWVLTGYKVQQMM